MLIAGGDIEDVRWRCPVGARSILLDEDVRCCWPVGTRCLLLEETLKTSGGAVLSGARSILLDEDVRCCWPVGARLQGWENYGPRATCGPRCPFVRPTHVSVRWC